MPPQPPPRPKALFTVEEIRKGMKQLEQDKLLKDYRELLKNSGPDSTLCIDATGKERAVFDQLVKEFGSDRITAAHSTETEFCVACINKDAQIAGLLSSNREQKAEIDRLRDVISALEQMLRL